MKINEKFIILLIVLFIIIGISLLGIFNNIREFNLNVDAYNYWINKCESMPDKSEDWITFCNSQKEWGGPKRTDAFFTFFDIAFDNNFMIMHLLLPFLILMYSIYQINQKLKSGFIKNELMRKKYSKFIKDEWITSVFKLWIIPFMFIFIFIAAYILTGNFNYRNSLFVAEPWVNPVFFNNIAFSIVIYLVNFILHGIFIVNIGYIASKKSRGYIFSILKSYILYLGLWAISEFFFGYVICNALLGKPEIHNYFSFTTMWGYPNINNFLLYSLYHFALALISGLFVYKMYKNKEGVICENE